MRNRSKDRRAARLYSWGGMLGSDEISYYANHPGSCRRVVLVRAGALLADVGDELNMGANRSTRLYAGIRLPAVGVEPIHVDCAECARCKPKTA